MKTIRKFAFVRVLVLMAAALSLSASLAAAQSLQRGTFTLPVEAHWGKAVLPAGAYSFSVESMSSYPLVTVRAADGKIAGMFVAEGVSTLSATAEQVLTLTRRGEEMYVSSLQLSDLQTVFEYRVPKAAETASVAGLTTP
jgi:hypothetical protein